MLAFFLALLGGAGVVGAAAGGRSSAKTVTPDQNTQAVTPAASEQESLTLLGADAIQKAKADNDIREAAQDYAPRKTPAVEQQQDLAAREALAVEDCDHDDGGSSGPCPKTGGPVCHCSSKDEDEDTQGDHAGHEMPVIEVVQDRHGQEMPAVEVEQDHAGHETPAVEDCDHDDGGSSGPCPKTGGPVCHCSSKDEDEDTQGDHAGHDAHAGHGSNTMAPPQTQAEIDAFVAAVRSSPEVHSHDAESSMAGEHMAAMDLVPRAEATHIAIGNGDWDDPANWHNGEVPGDDARALIPEGVHMTYDHVSDARLFTLRVDGHLDFATDVDSQLIVDTIVITPSGTLTIGTADDPVDPNVNVDIIFANNGPIDTDWDPTLLSRGMIAHGKVEIHGAEKDSHDKVIDDPRAGDTWVDFGDTPTGWAVGDKIVIAGTRYDGYYDSWSGSSAFSPAEDEIRVITQIEDGQVFFDEPLQFDHDTPRDDLKTSVANYTRNISFETENAETAEIFERGHIMFMHNDDVDVRYAEFDELGRTDKSETALNVGEFDQIEFDSNVKGRYSFHFHRSGTDVAEDDPAMAVGNAVYGSPGWGFVHHDSYAVLDNNATYNTFGAGYVAESGNETGAWNDNIAIYAKGVSWLPPKFNNDVNNFDLGKGGDGFWFQSRMVESTDNIAASVNNGFVYFHRGGIGETRNILFDSETTEIADILYNGARISSDEHPILEFSGNEVFAARSGLHVVKGNPNQNHDVHSVLEDFTAWSVLEGATFEYTSHYVLKDFDLIGKEETEFSEAGTEGIKLGGSTSDITFVDTTLENFDVGIDFMKSLNSVQSRIFTPEVHSYAAIDTKFINVENEYKNYDPALDKVLTSEELPGLKPDIALDGPLTYTETYTNGVAGGPDTGWIFLSGTKTDTLGTTTFPGGTDNYDIFRSSVIATMEEEGYYSTSDGQNYFMLDIYFSDRVSGDIFFETHPVLLDSNVKLGTGFGLYGKVPFNGVVDLGGDDDLTEDAATLWATLTDGQLVLTEEALAMENDKEEFLLDEAG